MKKKAYTLISFALALYFLSMVSGVFADSGKKINIRWGSSKAGSAGYVTLFGVAKIVKDNLPEIYIEAVPTAGSIASQRMYARGKLDGCYSGAWNLLDMYEDRGPYEKNPYPAGATKPYQTWYCYTADDFVLTKADRTDIKCWRDLAGKRVYIAVPGAAVFEMPHAAFKALGIWEKIKVVDLPFSAVSDALKMGTIDAMVGWTIARVTLVSWLKETDMRAKLKVVNPTADELETIKKVPGYKIVTLDPKVFSQDVGVAQITAISDHYGFHIGKNLSKEYVYKLVRLLIEHAEEVGEFHAVVGPYGKDPLSLQVAGINSIPEIPVHPGTAKYLKERGVWKKEWKVGEE